MKMSSFSNVQLLGGGSQAQVYSAYHCQLNKQVAIKVYDVHNDAAINEIKILRTIQKSPRYTHMLEFYGSFLEGNKLCLVMDYVRGMELHDYVINSPKLSMMEVKLIFTKLLLSVNDLHDNNICHLDLKLENIIYDPIHQDIKLIDFGFSEITTTKEHFGVCEKLLTKFCGSMHYSAPEIIRNTPYDGKKADIWALGVLLFVLIAGRFPYTSHLGVDAVALQILSQPIPFDHTFSTNAINLISLMMNHNPLKRPSLKQVLGYLYSNDF